MEIEAEKLFVPGDIGEGLSQTPLPNQGEILGLVLSAQVLCPVTVEVSPRAANHVHEQDFCLQPRLLIAGFLKGLRCVAQRDRER